MPAIYHEGSWLGNATDPEVLVKDTVGWTGKNLLKNKATSQTINGVTFTVNSDGSFTANGTASGLVNFIINSSIRTSSDVIFSMGQTGGTNFKVFITANDQSGDIASTGTSDSVQFNTNKDYQVHLIIYSGKTVNNLTFYPMIRKADISDPTYEPYHESVEVMYEEEIHGVNLLNHERVDADTKPSGFTYTVNSDNSVTFNGTLSKTWQYRMSFIAPFTGVVKLTGGVALLQHIYPWDVARNGRPFKDSSKTALVTANQYGNDGLDFYIEKGNQYTGNIRFIDAQTVNNVRFYPMIRKADIEDSTYRPYNPQAIQNQLNAQRVLGAKNLLPYTRDSSTYTQSGVTYTRNADGFINANGTATANSFLPIAEREKHPINNLKKGVEYILSGDYGLGSGNGYVYANFYNGSTRLGGVNTGGNGSVKFKIPESINGTVVDDIDFGIGVLNGKTVNNFTFYPMLRLASDPDDTYQPYAMTNRELTEKKINIADLKTVVSASSDFADFKTRIASL